MSDQTKKVAVCTDFTPIAQHAFEESLILARRCSAEVHLLHILDEEKETITTAEAKMVDMVKQAGDGCKGVDIKFHVSPPSGDIVDRINEEVAKLDPNYFVVGYELKSGMDRFFGPNIMRIVRGTKFPVIAIKKDETLDDLKRIVFPMNLWDYARQKTRATIRVAVDLGMTVDIVGLSVRHTAADDKKLKIYISQIEDSFREANVEFNTVYLSGDNEVNLVIDYANRNDADLISKVFHHDPSMIDLMMGNQDEELLAKTNMPLFVVKSRDFMVGSWGTMRG